MSTTTGGTDLGSPIGTRGSGKRSGQSTPPAPHSVRRRGSGCLCRPAAVGRLLARLFWRAASEIGHATARAHQLRAVLTVAVGAGWLLKGGVAALRTPAFERVGNGKLRRPARRHCGPPSAICNRLRDTTVPLSAHESAHLSWLGVSLHRAELRAAQSTSMMVALAIPPPSHIVCKPYLPPVDSSVLSSVAISRVPEAPSGWPRAMAPPRALSRSGSASISYRHGS